MYPTFLDGGAAAVFAAVAHALLQQTDHLHGGAEHMLI